MVRIGIKLGGLLGLFYSRTVGSDISLLAYGIDNIALDKVVRLGLVRIGIKLGGLLGLFCSRTFFIRTFYVCTFFRGAQV